MFHSILSRGSISQVQDVRDFVFRGYKTALPSLSSLLSCIIRNQAIKTNPPQRDRTRSPRGDRVRRSRSPRRSRRSYSRSRSLSREDYHRSDRRDRSPMSGAGGAPGGHSNSSHGGRGGPPPGRSFEDRSVAREHMMQSVRDSSQQDRRVYVGNLSYDVKWHHLKDFMRQGRL